MSNSNDRDLSGNASLLSQLSELQKLEDDYGLPAAAKFLTQGLERLEIETTEEKSRGFLETAKVLQQRDINVGYIVDELKDKAANIAINISKSLTQPELVSSKEE